MPLPLGGAIGAGAGGVLGFFEGRNAKDAEEKNRLLAAQTARYSPYTKLNAMDYIPAREPGAIASAIGGAAQGAQAGASLEKMLGGEQGNSYQDLQKKMNAIADKDTSELNGTSDDKGMYAKTPEDVTQAYYKKYGNVRVGPLANPSAYDQLMKLANGG